MPKVSPLLALLILELTFCLFSSSQAVLFSFTRSTQSSSVASSLSSLLKPKKLFILSNALLTMPPIKPYGSSILATHLMPLYMTLAIKPKNLKTITGKDIHMPPKPGALKVYSSFTSFG